MKAIITSVDVEDVLMEITPPGAPKSATAKIIIEVTSSGAWETNEKGWLNTEAIANRLANKVIDIKEIEF